MSTFQKITQTSLPITSSHAMPISSAGQNSVLCSLNTEPRTTFFWTRISMEPHMPIRNRPEWLDAEWRQGYLEASIEQGVAWAIKVNRTQRGISQKTLGKEIGSTPSAISRLEDPEYGKHSIGTLIKLAHAFDCALSIKFVSYSTLAHESEDLSPAALYAHPFSKEQHLIGEKLDQAHQIHGNRTFIDSSTG
jgi:transcriptional regulator with XRE-family HTH domain